MNEGDRKPCPSAFIGTQKGQFDTDRRLLRGHFDVRQELLQKIEWVSNLLTD